MEIEFGSFKNYIVDRGFGFVNRLLIAPHKKEVFAHIRNVKRSNQEIANKLNNEDGLCFDFFWYEIEKNEKGDQLLSIINRDSIKEKLSNNLPSIIKKIELILTDVNATPPQWAELAAKDLTDDDFVEKLKIKRKSLVEKMQIEREIKRKAEEEERKKAEEERNRLRAELMREKEIEDEEFRLLVEEIKPLQFTHSKQVSSYITRNRLGNKYKNISGVVKMEMQGTTWDFNGGFPPNIYAKLCDELNLSNQGTYARVVSFDSFKKLNNNEW